MNLDNPRVQSAIRKYGSVEAYRQVMRQRQKLSRIKYSGNGGFKNMDKDRVKEISRLGVQARGNKAENRTSKANPEAGQTL